jgi:hypothetical protein
MTGRSAGSLESISETARELSPHVAQFTGRKNY